SGTLSDLAATVFVACVSRGGCDSRGGCGSRAGCDSRGGCGSRGGCDSRGGCGSRGGCDSRGGCGSRGGCDWRCGSGSRGCDSRACCGSAAGSALFDASPSSTVRIACPTFTLSPALTLMSLTCPATDEGTSLVALSVPSSSTVRA